MKLLQSSLYLPSEILKETKIKMAKESLNKNIMPLVSLKNKRVSEDLQKFIKNQEKILILKKYFDDNSLNCFEAQTFETIGQFVHLYQTNFKFNEYKHHLCNIVTKKLCSMPISSALHYLRIIKSIVYQVSSNCQIQDKDIVLKESENNYLNLKDACHIFKIENTLEFSHTKYKRLTLGDWIIIMNNLRLVLIQNVGYNDTINQFKLKKIYDELKDKNNHEIAYLRDIKSFKYYFCESLLEFLKANKDLIEGPS